MDKEKSYFLEIVNCSPSAIYVQDLKGNYIYVNPQLEKIFAVPPKDTVELNDGMLFGDDSDCTFRDNDLRIVSLKQTIDRELSGSFEELQNSYISIKYPLTDSTGKKIGMCGILHNITTNLKFRLLFENNRRLLERALDDAKVTDWEYDIGPKRLIFKDSVSDSYISLLENIINSTQPCYRMCPDEYFDLKKSVSSALISGLSFEKYFTFLGHGNYNRLIQITCDVVTREGNPVTLRGAIHDVEELQSVWRNLREKDGCYQALFNNNFLKILIIDPNDGRIVDANEAALSYYGYDIKVIKEKKITDINTLSERAILEKMNLAVQGKRDNFRFKHQLADGSVRDVDVYSGPIVMSEKKLLYSMVHDVTERLSTESKLFKSNQLREEIFANINEAIFIIDPKTETIFDCNYFCYELLGYEYEECVGQKYHTFFYDKELSGKSISSLFSGCAGEKQFFSKETLIRKKNNTLVPVECDVISLCDESNTIYVYLCIMRDITRHKDVKYRLEQEVSQRTQELQDMNIALSVLLRRQQESKKDTEASLYKSYNKEIRPLLKRLKSSKNINEHGLMLRALEHNLKTIFSPAHSSVSVLEDLTPQENRIAAMIKEGMTSKEIATAVNASLRTVTTHRENIRKKLDIVKTQINLRTYLSSL